MYLLNRSPSSALIEMILEEGWTGVKDFRVFGCIGNVYVPDAKRTKLEEKSKRCVLLGVSSESKGYRMYDPIDKKLIVSRDVIFEEENRWEWKNNYGREHLMNVEYDGNAYEVHSERNEEMEEEVTVEANQDATGRVNNEGTVRRETLPHG